MTTMASPTQELCDKLVANDPDLTEVVIRLNRMSADEVERVFEALKQNIVIETLKIGHRGRLSLPATLSLVSAILVHPRLKTVCFEGIGFEEFSAVAVAIKQKDSVTSLLLEGCKISSSVNDGLKWLLRENAIESLRVVFVGDQDDQQPLDLAGALRHNRSLRMFELFQVGNAGLAASPDTLREIPILLKANENLEAIEVGISVPMDVVSLIVLAAENHTSLKKFALNSVHLDDSTAEAIGSMLKKNSPALEELDLAGCSISSEGFGCLISGLTDSDSCSNLEKLKVGYMDIADSGAIASHLGRLLAMNGTVKSLNASGNKITCDGASAIAAGLKENTTVGDLNLDDNEIGREGYAAIAVALCSNSSLTKLFVDVGQISLWEMLQTNTTLESISTNTFYESTLQALNAALPEMQGIKHISTLFVEGFTSETVNDFVKALEQNTSLETQSILQQRGAAPVLESVIHKVNHLLKLNRAGRRIVKSSVPRSYWPLILGRSSKDADAQFFFLHEKFDEICSNKSLPTRKRKQVREP